MIDRGAHVLGEKEISSVAEHLEADAGWVAGRDTRAAQ